MKRLKLIDSIGREFDLNDVSTAYIHDVSGLGTSFTNTYSNVSDGFFPTSNRKIAQGAVAGSIVFRSNEAYRDFVSFITSDGLKLGYAPAGAWFFASCSVTKLTKTDTAALDCSAEFKLLSPWAKQTPMRKSITAEGEVLTYPLRYPYKYGKASAEASAEFNISGHMRGAFELTITGAVRNPDIKLYRFEDGWKLFGKCSIKSEMGATDTLVLSTVPGKERVEFNGDDATGMLDITDNVFARPMVGKNKIVIESDSAITASAILNIYDYYYSV